MTYSKIVGVGGYTPKKTVTNKELEKVVDTSDEWIVERTGIHKRHIAEDGETTATMAINAARLALDNAKIAPEELDLIIVATCSPDMLFPSTACILQHEIGAKNAAAFDISAACSGFIYGLTTADQFIKSGAMKNVLVIGAETISRILDWNDRTTCVLFGDGAGAAVLTASDEPGIIGAQIYSDGSQKDILYAKSSLFEDEAKKHYVKMQGREVFRFAVDKMVGAVESLLEKNNMVADDVDWIIPHQANLRIIKMIASKLKISMDKVIATVDEHANTSSASIPLAFDHALKAGKIKPGQTVLMEAFGGGLTWGSVLLKL